VVSQKWQGHTGVFRVGSPVKERKKMVLSREELLAHRGIYRKEHKLEIKAYNHVYRQEHKSARNASNRMYRETHRDACRAYLRDYIMRDYVKDYRILYRQNHREEKRVSGRAYNQNHKLEISARKSLDRELKRDMLTVAYGSVCSKCPSVKQLEMHRCDGAPHKPLVFMPIDELSDVINNHKEDYIRLCHSCHMKAHVEIRKLVAC